MRFVRTIILSMLAPFTVIILFAQTSAASDLNNMKDPRYLGVERVFLYVKYQKLIDDNLDVSGFYIPEREYIEKLLLERYRKRFSSTECHKMFGTMTPYACNNQPVTLVPIKEKSSYTRGQDTSFATAEELSDPATLHIIYYVYIAGASIMRLDPPLNAPILVKQQILYRPGSNLPLSFRLPNIAVFPLNQDEKEVKIFLGDHSVHSE